MKCKIHTFSQHVLLLVRHNRVGEPKLLPDSESGSDVTDSEFSDSDMDDDDQLRAEQVGTYIYI